MTSSQSPFGAVSNLPQIRRLITSHNQDAKAIVHTAEEVKWDCFDDNQMALGTIYTTSQFPANLNNDADIKGHNDLLQKGPPSIVIPGGTIIRCVDFAPGYRCGMHRTQSLDYGTVLEGNIGMLLDSGDVEHMKRGDVAVQRATQHQWINASKTEWARMMFVLQDCERLEVGGKEMRDDINKDIDFLTARVS